MRFKIAGISLLGGFVLFAYGCSDQTPVRAYEVRGIVTEVPEDRETIVLSHDEIANYMPAMVMPFPLAHPDVAEGFAVGDEVLFHVVVTASAEASIAHMEMAPAFSGPFPEFELEGLTGGTIVSSTTLAGKVAIVNFWASWCAPCREEMPLLARLHNEFDDLGLEVIGIAQDPENMEDITAQVEELGINYAIAIGDGVVEEAVGGVYSIPTTFILDRDGTVVEKHIGLVSEQELRSAIEGLF
jgi:thiol-disulfide isomerase/thioredoxin